MNAVTNEFFRDLVTTHGGWKVFFDNRDEESGAWIAVEDSTGEERDMALKGSRYSADYEAIRLYIDLGLPRRSDNPNGGNFSAKDLTALRTQRLERSLESEKAYRSLLAVDLRRIAARTADRATKIQLTDKIQQIEARA